MSFGQTDYQQASAQELAQADQALSNFNDYKTNTLPSEQKYIASSVNREGRDSLRLGISGATAAQAIEPAIQNANQISFAGGINPNSGSFKAQNSGVNRLGIGSSVAGATVMNKGNYLSGLYSTVQGGQSLINGGTAGLNSLAGLEANQAQSDTAYNNALTAAYGDAAGTLTSGLVQSYLPEGLSGGSSSSSSGDMGLSIPDTSNTDYMKIYNGLGAV